MKEDVLRILKMVEDGKIDSGKATELIEALNGNKVIEKSGQTLLSNNEMMLKVKVLSANNDNVNVQMPIKFIKGVIGAFGKIPLNINGTESIDTAMLLQAIDSGLTGKIVDIKSGNGDIVEVIIE